MGTSIGTVKQNDIVTLDALKCCGSPADSGLTHSLWFPPRNHRFILPSNQNTNKRSEKRIQLDEPSGKFVLDAALQYKKNKTAYTVQMKNC